MPDTLARIADDAGPLLKVFETRSGGHPRFVTVVSLEFASLAAVFCAVEEDDTLAAGIGRLEPADGEVAVGVSGEPRGRTVSATGSAARDDAWRSQG